MSTAHRALSKQIKELHANPIEDIALLDIRELTTVMAWIFGPKATPFENHAFKICLSYDPVTYPANPPKGTFLTQIFHPNVSDKGEICVNTLKRDWNKDKDTVAHILTIIKCLMISPGPDSALNEEAGKLLMEDYAAYARRAKILTTVHGVGIDEALKELNFVPPLSCRKSVTGILGESGQNRANQNETENQGLGKTKQSETVVRKKLEAKKKNLKRL